MNIKEKKFHTQYFKEWVMTFYVTTTGLPFSKNRVHHLVNYRVVIACIFYLIFFLIYEREREREREREIWMFSSLSVKPTEINIYYFFKEVIDIALIRLEHVLYVYSQAPEILSVVR